MKHVRRKSSFSSVVSNATKIVYLSDGRSVVISLLPQSSTESINMNLLLVLAVCFVSMVDVSLAGAPVACISCGEGGTACALTTTGSSGGSWDNCQVVLSRTDSTVEVIDRMGVTGACPADNAAAFASGTETTRTICTSGADSNGDTYQGTNLGCYTCSGTASSCTTIDETTVKAYDGTLKQTGMKCKTVLTYNRGELTGLVRSRVNTAECAEDSNTVDTTYGTGVKTVCCFSTNLCNGVTAPATTTSRQCYYCGGASPQPACTSTLPTATTITDTHTFCRTTVSINSGTTAVTVVRDSVAACPSQTNAATFATGAEPALVLCSATSLGNSATTFAATSIGCYSCADKTVQSCITPDGTTVKVYDNTVAETGKGCKTVMDYTSGVLTTLTRARGPACTNSNSINAAGTGTRTVCCTTPDLCNNVVAVATLLKCYYCGGSQPACTSTLPTATTITDTHTNCKTTVSINSATTAVTVVRDSAATCTTNAAEFATGAASPLVLCSTATSGNGATFADKSFGCYSCTGLSSACLNPAANSGTKVYDGTLQETGKSCSTALTYVTGVLTNIARARGAACTDSDTTSASGDGVKTVCCNNKDLCNDAVFAISGTTAKPITTNVPKHAPKNIINAFVLISAVILAVVSK